MNWLSHHVWGKAVKECSFEIDGSLVINCNSNRIFITSHTFLCGNLNSKVNLLSEKAEIGNIRSYQWKRLGVELKGLHFGLAANLDEYGPGPSFKSNLGVFFRKEIL